MLTFPSLVRTRHRFFVCLCLVSASRKESSHGLFAAANAATLYLRLFRLRILSSGSIDWSKVICYSVFITWWCIGRKIVR